MTVTDTLNSFMTTSGLSTSEASYVMTKLMALPQFQWSAWLWTADPSTLSQQALARLIGNAAYEAVTLIDTLEPNHWARPLFASAAVPIAV